MSDYYMKSGDECLKEFNSSLNGLSEKAVVEKQKYGKNVIEVKNSISFWYELILQFNNFLVWLLIIIALFSFVTGFYFHKQEEIINGIVVSIIIIANSFISAYQDYKSEKSAELLKNMLKNTALVRRNGEEKEIDAEELVVGDIVLLEEGRKIPADCRLLEAKDLYVDESILTGESKTVRKDVSVISEKVSLADRKNMVFMNTFVTRGKALCVVTAIGKKTEVGKISESLDEREEKSPFIDEVSSASKTVTYVALVLIAIAVTIFYLKTKDFITTFLIGAALIIGAIPEGLPAIVTFTLAYVSKNLASKNTLVKKKSLLETLGSVDTICTDKTGTLTINQMRLKKVFLDNSVFDVSSSEKDILKDYFFNPKRSHFVNCVALTNEAERTGTGYSGDAEDLALIDVLHESGLKIHIIKKDFKVKKFEPFSSETKYSSALVMDKSNNSFYYKKGAPEVILKNTKHMLVDGSIKKINKADLEKINKIIINFSDDALRILAFSVKMNSKDIFVGLVGLYDQPKEGIQKTIATIYEAGIDIKMLTGDNILTAKAIAKECGFKNIKAISWNDLKDKTEYEFKKEILRCNVFARMSPDFKSKIIDVLKKDGKRVAITGDGVNDVPALKKADVGVVMGKRGSDIAKEAGDIILLDDNLDSLVLGIREGRRIFDNVRKVINYLLTANLAEVLVVFFSSLLGLVPFEAIQLLWVNFVTDIAPAMSLGIDPPHKNLMKQKPTGKNEKLINERITLLTIFIGIKKVFLIFFLFLISYRMSNNLKLAQTLAFTWLVFSHFIRVAAIRFDEKVPFFENKVLNWSIFIPIVLQLIIIYTPISKFFDVVPLTIREWLILLSTLFLALILAKLTTMAVDFYLVKIKKMPRD